MSRRGHARYSEPWPEDIELAFNPHEPRLPDGRWTNVDIRAWLSRHPVDSKNVVDMWDQGTEGEHEAGEHWYPDAHKVAVALAKKQGVSVREAAGLLATYSPQTPWGRNVIEASEALREHQGIGGPGAHIFYHHDPSTPNTFEEREGVMASGADRRRAERILAGEDFEDVFAGRNKNGSRKPTSLKIRSFAELIANGTQADDQTRVVIDRHAAGVARGVRLEDVDYAVEGPSSSQKKFSAYADAYKEAAAILSKREGRTIPPEAVQAATWLTRQRLNSEMDSQVGRTRKSLGERDARMLSDYEQTYLPELLDHTPKTGYQNLSVIDRRDIDLAVTVKRGERPVGVHYVLPKIDKDETVRQIAAVLMKSLRAKPLPSDYDREVRGISRLLKDYGIKPQAVRMAVSLARTRSGYRRGTAHLPNARLRGAKLTGAVRDARDQEVYFRAGYLANAAKRMQAQMDDGATQQEALKREAPYYRQHEQARRSRLDSAAEVQRVANDVGIPDEHGTLCGWYLNPLLNNEAECIAANGHNFYAEDGTVIGLPGSVHNNCGCVTGPPHQGAAMVNDVLRNVVKLSRAKPRFKLKERRRA